MSAVIDMSNNRANIAFQGEVPWHGLGTNVEPNQPLEIWMQNAGLDWEAKKAPVQFVDHTGETITTDRKILYRNDTGVDLGVVTDRYKTVQPKEVLEFYRDLVATQGWDIEVAGSLDGGKRIWALAKTDADLNIAGTVDKVGTYLLLATSYDGTMATIGKFTSVRVVCQNTLTMSMNDGIASVKVPHSREFNAEAVKNELGIYEDVSKQFAEEADILAKQKMSEKDSVKFLMNILTGKDNPEELSTRSANIVKGVYDLYAGKGMGSTLKSAEGTTWGLLNAVTEYVDHHQGRNNNNRIRNGWFGQGENLKRKAKGELLAIAA